MSKFDGMMTEKFLRRLEASHTSDEPQADAPELYEALDKLANEASGFLAAARVGDHGVTNMRLLARRIKEAREVLAKARGDHS